MIATALSIEWRSDDNFNEWAATDVPWNDNLMIVGSILNLLLFSFWMKETLMTYFKPTIRWFKIMAQLSYAQISDHNIHSRIFNLKEKNSWHMNDNWVQRMKHPIALSRSICRQLRIGCNGTGPKSENFEVNMDQAI